jgi:hypothetical protein
MVRFKIHEYLEFLNSKFTLSLALSKKEYDNKDLAQILHSNRSEGTISFDWYQIDQLSKPDKKLPQKSLTKHRPLKSTPQLNP